MWARQVKAETIGLGGFDRLKRDRFRRIPQQDCKIALPYYPY
jgi:hypothetical protein